MSIKDKSVDKRALQDQVSFGLTLVVHLGCSGCLKFCRLYINMYYSHTAQKFEGEGGEGVQRV